MSVGDDFELSNDGSAILVTPGKQHTPEFALELWINGQFWQTLDLLPPAAPSASRINRIVSREQERPLSGWVSEGLQECCPINFSASWSLAEQDTAYLYSQEGGATAVYQCPIEGCRLTAIPDEVYTFRGRFGVHRCQGRVEMSFSDAKGRPLRSFSSDIPSHYLGGCEVSGYAEVVVKGRAPSHAATLSIIVEKGANSAGDDGFLFFALTTLTRGEAGSPLQTDPVTFSANSTVSIFSLAAPEVILLFPSWPELLSCDNPSDIALISRSSGSRVERRDFRVRRDQGVELKVFGLEGGVIVAAVTRAPAKSSISLALWADGALVDRQRLPTPAEGDHIRLPLPHSICDGRPHLFQVRDEQDNRLLGQFADFGPDGLTPWSALQRYAGAPLPIHRSPAMGDRYRALSESLHDLTRGSEEQRDAAIDRLRTLSLAHEIVVEGFERKRSVYLPLVFSRHAAPRVSVIIPVHNKFEVTYNCLASLILAKNIATFEVIVVDDGSADKTIGILDCAINIKCVRNESPLGFVGACNRGAHEAVGDFVVFLNNDTEPTIGWLDELLFVFDNFDHVGLVGSKLLYADGRLQEAGGIVWGTGDPWNYGRGDNPKAPQYSYTREVDYVSGASMMISNTLWRQLGGFSQEFAPAYFEDTDLAFKVKNAGRKVVFAPLSVVYHFEGLSNGTDTSTTSGLKRFQEINRPKFKRKWRALTRENGQVGIDVHLAKDRGVTSRVVMFDIDTPRLDNDAGSYAAVQEMRLLQSLGFKVTFVPSNLAYLGRHTAFLQRIGVEVVYAPFIDSIEAFISDRITEFDLVYVTRYQMAQRLTELIRTANVAVPVVCNIADLHFLRGIREAAHEATDVDSLAQLRGRRDEEMSALGKTDLILTYSVVEEAVIISHYLGSKKVALLPWVIDPSRIVPRFEERQGIAFLGGFGHPPNVSAVEFFALEVMPLLREKLPGVPFRVYGSNVPERLKKLAATDIIIEGYVPDIASIFQTCRVFVAPLKYGAGVKGKVLDCLAAGVPAVLSPAAVEALPLSNGTEALIAEKNVEWADAVARLYSDEAIWTSMSNAALDLATRNFAFSRGREMMAAALEQVDLYADQNPSSLCITSARPTLK